VLKSARSDADSRKRKAPVPPAMTGVVCASHRPRLSFDHADGRWLPPLSSRLEAGVPASGQRACPPILAARAEMIDLLFPMEEALVARTPGASNRTPRELRAEAKRLTERADYIEKTKALKKELDGAKAQRKRSAR
jgi:hypothetical protein